MDAQSLLVLDLEKCTRCDECVRGLRRRARRRHAAGPRGAALRQVPGGHARAGRAATRYCMVGCPVGSIRRRELARDHHRGLVHRLRHVRRELPVRQHQHAPVRGRRCADPGAARRGRSRRSQQKATSCDLCMEHEEPSCVYACPHDAAHRVEPLTFFASMRRCAGEVTRRWGVHGATCNGRWSDQYGQRRCKRAPVPEELTVE